MAQTKMTEKTHAISPDQTSSNVGNQSDAESGSIEKPDSISPLLESLPTADIEKIKEGWQASVNKSLEKNKKQLAQYCCVAIMDSEGTIGTFDLDQVFASLKTLNPDRKKDVLLVLLSYGGAIEPACQISKICKAFSKARFVVAIPRYAKSAATLLAIGADEIHMSALGQLGPIDPQLVDPQKGGGLPALGVASALRSIAELSQQFPGSSEMFAKYLNLALTVEQIGFCERIAESVAQYAERLLSTKPALVATANSIARELVHEYKHHGFVIDLIEARRHLGEDWILTDTPEIAFAEEIYGLFNLVNLLLGYHQSKRIWLTGNLAEGLYLV